MLLFYIRHGDPIYEPDSLTPLGKRQAEAVAKRLALYGIDQIYASSSNRAILTAQPACELLKKKMTVLDWCDESHAWKGMTVVDPETNQRKWGYQHQPTRELFCSAEMTQLGENWYEHPFFADTKFRECSQRIRKETYRFLEELGFAYDEQKQMYKVLRKNEDRTALFAHQGFGLAFLSRVLGIPYPWFCTHFDMGHTGMTVIEFKTDQQYCIPCVLMLANDSHIYREGLPTKYQNRICF